MRKLAGLILALLLLPWGAVAQLPNQVDGQELPTLAPMLEQAMPGVVNIATTGRIQTRESPLLQDPFFRHFFDLPEQPRERQTRSLGSGVVVDAEQGYILTNHHVIARADQITVTFADGREQAATLVGSDPDTDVAVIRVEPDDLHALPMANSDHLRVGDFVVAIGNPFGLGQTVTSGIVSALGRSGLNLGTYQDFIQTDASINPGNSGGALVNLRGELIGINTAIIAPAGGNVGIGFAIPMNMARSIMDQLIEHGEVSRGQLGISIQDLSPKLAEAFGLDRQSGVVITQVLTGSPAERADLATGDVVVNINGQPVRNATELRNAIGLLRVGETVELEILRDGRRQTTQVTIDALEPATIAGEQTSSRLAGAEFGLTEVRTRQGVQSRVVVMSVEPGGPAQRSGLREGDIILSVNRQVVTNLEQFRKLASNQRELLLHVQRGSGALFLLLR